MELNFEKPQVVDIDGSNEKISVFLLEENINFWFKNLIN